MILVSGLVWWDGRVAVHEPSGQPVLGLQELALPLGAEVQLAVRPVLQTTSHVALTRFSPAERGCYDQVCCGRASRLMIQDCRAS